MAVDEVPAYHSVLSRGDWVEYVVVKAVNCSILFETPSENLTVSLKDGDKMRVDIVDVYAYTYPNEWIYPNGTVAMILENSVFLNVSFNGEVLPFTYSDSAPFVEQFHPVGGDDYWSRFKEWGETIYNRPEMYLNFSMVIGDANVSISYLHYDADSTITGRYDYVVCKYTGVPLEAHGLRPNQYESHLKIVDTNIPIGKAPPTAVSLNTPAPNEIGNSSVVLRWTASPDEDFSKYEIYMFTSATEPGTLVTTIDTKATTTYTVTNLSPGTTYYFMVRVYNTGNAYADSNKVAVTAGLPLGYIPGVSVGQYVKYGNFVGVGPGLPAENVLDWLKTEVVAVSGKEVTLRTSGQFQNGTATPGSGSSTTYNVETGMMNGTVVYTYGPIIAANLNEGDAIPPTSYGYTINKTETRTYLGVSRSVNILNTTYSSADYANRWTIIYDKASGMQLEMEFEWTNKTATPPTTIKTGYSVIETARALLRRRK